MLLNLSGAHAPYFIRNVILLSDSAGHIGVGEVPGGESIREVLEEARPLVIGTKVVDLQPSSIPRLAAFVNRDAAGRGPQTFDQRVTIPVAATAIESALLDLLGQFLRLPVASLLGEGQQRNRIDVLGYLTRLHRRQKSFQDARSR